MSVDDAPPGRHPGVDPEHWGERFWVDAHHSESQAPQTQVDISGSNMTHPPSTVPYGGGPTGMPRRIEKA